MVVLKTKMEIYDLEYWTDLIGSLLIIFGCAFLFVGGIGLFRLRDVFERMHGASLIDTMGIGLIFIGLMFKLDTIVLKFTSFDISISI